MASNKRVDIDIPQPKTDLERTRAAVHCCDSLKMALPLLVDGIDDAVGREYSGFPDRLYLIDRDGRVAYKGGRGPFGYKPRELEQSLIMLLLDEAQQTTSATSEASTTPNP
jgi:Iodothyronine deiodinase